MRRTRVVVALAVLGVVAFAVSTCPRTVLAPTTPPATTVSHSAAEDEFAGQRTRMVEQDLRGRDITDERVLAAMGAIPRHRFVPEAQRDRAYSDGALPIGFGQTISQPYIVALMTQLAQVKPGDRVLEIGTGSGYQAAILAELGAEVYTVEIVQELSARAGTTLRELGYQAVETKVDDGYDGWQEQAPFDAILVTCAPDHIPRPLVQQLADGGRMVIPVGPPGFFQSLWRVDRKGDQILTRNVTDVIFVPMTGVAERR